MHDRSSTWQDVMLQLIVSTPFFRTDNEYIFLQKLIMSTPFFRNWQRVHLSSETDNEYIILQNGRVHLSSATFINGITHEKWNIKYFPGDCKAKQQARTGGDSCCSNGTMQSSVGTPVREQAKNSLWPAERHREKKGRKAEKTERKNKKNQSVEQKKERNRTTD